MSPGAPDEAPRVPPDPVSAPASSLGADEEGGLLAACSCWLWKKPEGVLRAASRGPGVCPGRGRGRRAASPLRDPALGTCPPPSTARPSCASSWLPSLLNHFWAQQIGEWHLAPLTPPG